ncbi:hypothetical protein [Fulvivirga lutimaris]|uniref:hypothetical protein n=1 Tax=Fulvivirga lutimaris TaxID=1819566 RepID=UPI0012BBE143|nr:hypothetical protein [Fulvivirga lutimaris]MTI38211.1 hypothetical protein [Fulvivirga lutimaris]
MKQYTPYFPIVGMALYLIVFAYTTTLYPGGSINEPLASSHSYFHNFLCDLMNPTAAHGVINPARPLAIVAHLILSFTMISFFYILPEIFDTENRNTKLMRGFGMFTMTVFILMYTSYHDLIVTLTGAFGTVALVPFFIELYKYQGKRLKQLAYACYAMSIIVFISFQTKIGFYYLPFLQKITFVLDAIWVIWVSLIVLKKHKDQKQLAATAV